eukprot:3251873-Prorocentrum_lima.AAC.1
MGQTTTNSFGYNTSTCGMKMFITSNTWMRELEACSDENREWLRDNSLYVQELDSCRVEAT